MAMLFPHLFFATAAKSTFRLIRGPIELSSRVSGQIDQFGLEYVEYKVEEMDGNPGEGGSRRNQRLRLRRETKEGGSKNGSREEVAGRD